MSTGGGKVLSSWGGGGCGAAGLGQDHPAIAQVLVLCGSGAEVVWIWFMSAYVVFGHLAARCEWALGLSIGKRYPWSNAAREGN